MNKDSRYRRDIQALRGIAVLGVVLFHFDEQKFALGYLGVDSFFVISGFVITPLILDIVLKKKALDEILIGLRRFFAKRFFRLAPALSLTLVISCFLVFLLGPVGDHERFLLQGISTSLMVGNIGAFRYSGDYFSPNPNPLLHTWSLSVEEQIYLIFPLIILLSARTRFSPLRVIKVTLGFILLLSLTSFIFPTILSPVYSFMGIQTPARFSFYSPADRIWQFSLGGLGYLYSTKIIIVRKNHRILLNILVISLAALFLTNRFNLDQRANSIIVSFITIYIIVVKTFQSLPEYSERLLVWIGDRSYSIYLIHMPLLYIAKFSPLLDLGEDTSRTLCSALAVLGTVIFGNYSYKKIELRYRYSQDMNGASEQLDIKKAF